MKSLVISFQKLSNWIVNINRARCPWQYKNASTAICKSRLGKSAQLWLIFCKTFSKCPITWISIIWYSSTISTKTKCHNKLYWSFLVNCCGNVLNFPPKILGLNYTMHCIVCILLYMHTEIIIKVRVNVSIIHSYNFFYKLNRNLNFSSKSILQLQKLI